MMEMERFSEGLNECRLGRLGFQVRKSAFFVFDVRYLANDKEVIQRHGISVEDFRLN